MPAFPIACEFRPAERESASHMIGLCAVLAAFAAGVLMLRRRTGPSAAVHRLEVWRLPALASSNILVVGADGQ